MVSIETSVFTRRVRALLDDDEYRLLQAALVQNPEAGPVIAASGCLRKIRWRASGRGTSGGVRVVYYWAVAHAQLLLLMIYAKNEQDDLSPDQLKLLKKAVEEECS